MKTLLLFISLFLLTSSITTTHNCTATWYDTTYHPKVRRDCSTAAFNHYEKGTKVLVTNLSNNKSDTVVITDRNGCGYNHIDLCKQSFQKIANHKLGKIKVIVKKIG